MINLVITEKGASFEEGIPTIFVSDADFYRIINDSELVKSVYSYFKIPVCVGRLGVKMDGIYSEDTIKIPPNVDEKAGELSYYERV